MELDQLHRPFSAAKAEALRSLGRRILSDLESAIADHLLEGFARPWPNYEDSFRTVFGLRLLGGSMKRPEKPEGSTSRSQGHIRNATHQRGSYG